MRTFEHGNWSNEDTCPICGTNDDKEVILVPIVGTADGNIAQAKQVHTECLGNGLIYNQDQQIIFVICDPENTLLREKKEDD